MNQRFQFVHPGTGEVVDRRIFFATPYNHDTRARAKTFATRTIGESKTDQSFKEEADINTIVSRIAAGKMIHQPLPMHFGEQPTMDLFEARTRIAESNKTFYNLPPDIRAEFQNDPARWEQAVLKATSGEQPDIPKLKALGLKVDEKPKEEPPKPLEGDLQPSSGGGEKGGLKAPPEPPKETDKGK